MALVRGVECAGRSLEGAAPHVLLDVGAVVVAAGLELDDVVRREQEGDDEDCGRLSAVSECVLARSLLILTREASAHRSRAS